MRARPSAGRESALDLLTVDALVTYAFEAAAEPGVARATATARDDSAGRDRAVVNELARERRTYIAIGDDLVTTEAREHFTGGLRELARLATLVSDTLGPDLDRALGMVRETVSGGGTLFFCGNGGSAADAQHWRRNTSFASCAIAARIPPSR